MELELETAVRSAPAPMPEAKQAEMNEAEIKLCRIDDPDCEACQ